jgi:hypothetical protein
VPSSFDAPVIFLVASLVTIALPADCRPGRPCARRGEAQQRMARCYSSARLLSTLVDAYGRV